MASRILCKSTAAFRPATTSFLSRQSFAKRTIASTATLRHKESASQHDGHELEKHKEDLVKKHKDGKGHWKPELASDSEEAVKADRSDHEDVKDLQERTKKLAEETHKSGTSMHDGL